MLFLAHPCELVNVPARGKRAVAGAAQYEASDGRIILRLGQPALDSGLHFHGHGVEDFGPVDLEDQYAVGRAARVAAASCLGSLVGQANTQRKLLQSAGFSHRPPHPFGIGEREVAKRVDRPLDRDLDHEFGQV